MHRKQRDDAPGLSSRNVLLAVVVSLALAAPALADVTLKEKTVSTGLAGFGNGTSERTIVIAGDKSRSDEQFTCTGRFRTPAGGGKPGSGTDIARLDREGVWSLDPRKKEYPGTGRKDKINGFDADNVIVSTPKDAKSGQTAGSCTIRMDRWLSAQVPGQAGAMAFCRRYAVKLGLDPQQRAQMEQARAEAQKARAEEQSRKEAREDDAAKVEAGAAIVSFEVPSGFRKVERRH